MYGSFEKKMIFTFIMADQSETGTVVFNLHPTHKKPLKVVTN